MHPLLKCFAGRNRNQNKRSTKNNDSIVAYSRRSNGGNDASGAFLMSRSGSISSIPAARKATMFPTKETTAFFSASDKLSYDIALEDSQPHEKLYDNVLSNHERYFIERDARILIQKMRFGEWTLNSCRTLKRLDKSTEVEFMLRYKQCGMLQDFEQNVDICNDCA